MPPDIQVGRPITESVLPPGLQGRKTFLLQLVEVAPSPEVGYHPHCPVLHLLKANPVLLCPGIPTSHSILLLMHHTLKLHTPHVVTVLLVVPANVEDVALAGIELHLPLVHPSLQPSNGLLQVPLCSTLSTTAPNFVSSANLRRLDPGMSTAL